MPPAAFDLFTIGHSNHPIERFIDLVRGAGVSAIADVRSTPASRRYPWFNAARLKPRLEAEGIAYVPLGDALGGRPRDQRLYRDDGVADYAAMARTEEFRAGLDRVGEGARHYRVCLMCAEREPLDCHRCLLVAPALVTRGFSIGHILADGRIEPHADTETRLIKLARVEPDLFADHAGRVAAAYARRAGSAAYRRT
ncbi:MAG TPA: DUF488 domain-containing protein [Xanthobacteraceae bacterium]|jgi:uncharacterized protein (DUF488 family)|nr:DUF488 domain-containing protein [Xanthobacteraceae bacterium]